MTDFVSIDFYVDIDIKKTLYAYFYDFLIFV